MNQLKKLLFGVAVIALPALLAAPAMAQGVAFQSTSLPRQVRVEGRTETVGEVNLLASNTGTVLAGSSITITYDAKISNVPGPGNVTCVEDAVPTSCAGDITVTPSGNQLIISITTSITFTASVGRITVAGVRADVSALGSGTAAVNAALSGTSAAPGTNPITFTQGSVPVGTVQARAIDERFPTTPQVILTCVARSITSTSLAAIPGSATVTIRVDELFPAALTSVTDETGFAATPVPTVGTVIRVTLTGVPEGFTILPIANTASGALPVVPLSLPGAKKSTGAPLTFDYTVGPAAAATLTGTVEGVSLNYTIQAARGDVALLGGAASVVRATVSLETVDTSSVPTPPATITIISFATNVQEEGTVFTVQDCQTYLLFSWLPNTGDGAFDSGIAINNSSKDPAVIGTAGQTGDVDVYFWRTDGTVPAASPVKLATALAPGQTATGVVSALLGEEFVGYAIAVCNFQFGHGFAFINSPQPGSGGAFAQGYLPLSLFNPRLAGVAGTESLGH